MFTIFQSSTALGILHRCLFFSSRVPTVHFFALIFSFFLFFVCDVLKSTETQQSFDDASPKCKTDRAAGSCRHWRVIVQAFLAPRVFDTTICVDLPI